MSTMSKKIGAFDIYTTSVRLLIILYKHVSTKFFIFPPQLIISLQKVSEHGGHLTNQLRCILLYMYMCINKAYSIVKSSIKYIYNNR